MHEHLSQNIDMYASTLPEGVKDWGVAISELAPEQRLPRKIEDVFATRDEALEVANKIVSDGGVEISNGGEGQGDFVEVTIKKSELSAVGCDEEFMKGFAFDESDVKNPAARELLLKATDKKVKEAAARKVLQKMDRDFNALDSRYLEHAKNLTQLYTIENGRGGEFRIFNFSGTNLEGDKLAQLLNAVREMDQLTGGRSTEAVKAVGIFSEDDPMWAKTGESKPSGANVANAAANGMGGIAINERLLKIKTARQLGSAESTFVVGKGEIEATMFHEMTHVIEGMLPANEPLPSEEYGWTIPRAENGYMIPGATAVFEGAQVSPSKYGTSSPGEDVAESATAMFAGGEWHHRLNDERIIAIQGLYAKVHSGQVGPAYIRCNEVNLGSIGDDSKLGTNLTEKVTFTPNIYYGFENEVDAKSLAA